MYNSLRDVHSEWKEHQRSNTVESIAQMIVASESGKAIHKNVMKYCLTQMKLDN